MLRHIGMEVWRRHNMLGRYDFSKVSCYIDPSADTHASDAVTGLPDVAPPRSLLVGGQERSTQPFLGKTRLSLRTGRHSYPLVAVRYAFSPSTFHKVRT